MAFEQTTKENKYQITKKQHFHMQAILERFVKNGQIKIIDKKTKEIKLTDSNNICFRANRAWSEELETKISQPIENKFLAQVRRIETCEPICDHEAISKYHLLWCLRHHYSQKEVDDFTLYKGMKCAPINKEVEELTESWGKVPIRPGGVISSRFKTTIDIKQLLLENESIYQGYKWQVIVSNKKPFISADCYGDCLLMAISPKYMLKGYNKGLSKNHSATEEEVTLLNEKSVELADKYYFE